MASNVQLESKQKLPQKLQDVVCDISQALNNAIATSGSNELMTNSFKAIVSSEVTTDNSSRTLLGLATLLDEFDMQFARDGVLEKGVVELSDAQESLQRLEKLLYRTPEEMRRDELLNDSDHQQMLKDRELLGDDD